MPEALLAKDRQRRRDAARDRPNAGVVDEHIKLAVPLTCDLHEVGQLVGLSRDGFKSPLYIELQAPRLEDVRKAVEEIASWDDLFEVCVNGR